MLNLVVSKVTARLWKVKRSMMGNTFSICQCLCSSVRHLGTLRTHTLRYRISSRTVLLSAYSSDGQYQCSWQSPNCNSPFFQNHFLKSGCVHINPWYVGPTGALSTIFEITVPFMDIITPTPHTTNNWRWGKNVSPHKNCITLRTFQRDQGYNVFAHRTSTYPMNSSCVADSCAISCTLPLLPVILPAEKYSPWLRQNMKG
jgi:hypothetical protein